MENKKRGGADTSGNPDSGRSAVPASPAVPTQALHRARQHERPALPASSTHAIERKVRFGFAVALALLGMVSALSYYSIVQFRESAAAAQRAALSIDELKSLLGNLRDVETGIGRYVITGDAAHLAPHSETIAVIAGDIRQLRELTAGDTGQQRRLDALTGLIAARMKIAEEVIAARRDSGFAAGRAAIAGGEGKRVTDAIRALMAEMEEVEDTLTQVRDARAEHYAQLTKGGIVLGSVLAFGFVVSALFLIGRDFAGRRHADATVRRQAQLLDLARDSIFVNDLDNRVLYWNRGAQRLYGWAPDEAVGRIAYELLATRFPIPREEINRLLLEAGHWTGELTHTTRDGRTLTVDSHWSLRRDDQGQPEAVLEISDDITQRKKAEAELHTAYDDLEARVRERTAELARSNELLRLREQQITGIVGSAMDGIMTVDEEQHVVLFNAAAENIFGCTAATMLGQPLDRLLPERFRTAHHGHIDQFGNSGATARKMSALGTLMAMRADGTEFPMEASISQVRVGGRRLYTVILRDITARMEADTRAKRQADFYAALSQTNQAIVHMHEPEALYKEICRICVECGHARMAYIGLIESSRVVPVAWAGPAEEFLGDIELPFDPSLPEGRGPMAHVIREARHCIRNDYMNDPNTLRWRDRAARIGTQSTAAFPFRRAGTLAGILSLHIVEKNFFDAQLIELLEEMTNDLSFALDNFDREAARTEAERESQRASERFEKIFLGAPEAMSVSELERGRIVLVNEAFCKLLGYSREELIGRTSLELGLWADPARRAVVVAALHEGRAARGLDGQTRTRSGELRDVLYSAESIELGHETHLLLMLSDITERKRAEARIEYLATHDGLTDLPNRNLMRDRITRAISHAKRAGGQLALMFLDLDRFKVINDGFGHPFGDAVLKATGERLISLVRDEDTVARESGDEFLVLLDDLSRSTNAYIVAQKMLDAFEQPFVIQEREVYVTASIGVSVYPQDGETADALIGSADAAMYRSKGLGRGTYQFFTQAMSDATRQQVELETQLRVAIAKDQLHLVYQPKVDLASGRIAGCEALLRWDHPERGAISPARFIPIAEECGLIVPIGDWVLRTACLQNKAWREAGLPPVVVSVNISARQFLRQDMLSWVMKTLGETALAPELLELELTESLIAQETEKVIATVNQLKTEGVKLSIDDFGTGYSSLSYLKRFRVDTLKIDQSFIRNMLEDPDDAVIALAVIALGHSLRMKVIAEGVETAEQCEFLRQHGCDELQGYYFSKPVPPAEFAEMLASGNRLAQGEVKRIGTWSS